MSHFAKVVDGIVTQVIVAEPEFFDPFKDTTPGRWIQTSYNGRIRKNFAGIGYKWLGGWDMFVPPKPEEGNWVLNRDTGQWEEVTE